MQHSIQSSIPCVGRLLGRQLGHDGNIENSHFNMFSRSPAPEYVTCPHRVVFVSFLCLRFVIWFQDMSCCIAQCAACTAGTPSGERSRTCMLRKASWTSSFPKLRHCDPRLGEKKGSFSLCWSSWQALKSNAVSEHNITMPVCPIVCASCFAAAVAATAKQCVVMSPEDRQPSAAAHLAKALKHCTALCEG